LKPKLGPSQLLVGHIAGVFGVKGWVKIHSYTDPIENILQYRSIQLGFSTGWEKRRLLEGRRHGKGLVALIEGVETPEFARTLLKTELVIERSELPKIGKDEYYWTDLIGLEVVTIDGHKLGKVSHLIETGANDVMIVRSQGEEAKRERYVPYIRGEVIHKIDLETAQIEVDWDPDF
jgi:16S rRNA processing protein RimM